MVHLYSGKTNNRIKTRKNKLKTGRSEAFSDTNAADDFEIEDLALDISEEEIRAWRAELEQSAGDDNSSDKKNSDGQNAAEKYSNTAVPGGTCRRGDCHCCEGCHDAVPDCDEQCLRYQRVCDPAFEKTDQLPGALALDHVSFNVYKGEVVGIIGTNGSGKSTLLKIVSGALKPSSGEVQCDRRKVQLLTLGTGFDVELTAKENVYLNGAIIGYSKEFIDSKYDEIVRFAELEGFMEEKVKNFSSGMVSRLGFAIATIGETAEILILDEVLSVGDEFFRKKSLKRVKEMIHGGSTVLLVSHSMGTILENCDRVVWIEKGKMKMYGEPKVVCEAYRKMNEG